jgi:hypothetical protein
MPGGDQARRELARGGAENAQRMIGAPTLKEGLRLDAVDEPIQHML